MKINQKILSIPPYISTSWKNVVSLHIEKKDGKSILVIGLVNGSTIEIPNLEQPILEAAFKAHEKYLEQDQEKGSKIPPGPILPPEVMGSESSALLSLPLRFGFESNMGNLLQHNPEAADSPDLPPEVIQKIATLSSAIGLDNIENFPKPEPHCNCMHCQIMRAFQKKEQQQQEHPSVEEEISDDDLRFREWDIHQKGDQLYIVTNPLNKEEHYDVFLGSPIGCTCGRPNCEHIKAVLNS